MMKYAGYAKKTELRTDTLPSRIPFFALRASSNSRVTPLMWRKSSTNKYGAVATNFEGIVYHSKKEANFAQGLALRKKAGDIKDWKRQIPFKLIVRDKLVTTYIIDFAVLTNKYEWEYVEVKSHGTETPYWKLKYKLFQILYPMLNVRVEY